MTKNFCSHPDCDRVLRSDNRSGACQPHANWARWGAEHGAAPRCAADGCARDLHRDNSTGYCRPHTKPTNREAVRLCGSLSCGSRLRHDNGTGFCGKHAGVDPEIARSRKLARYSLTPEQFEAILVAQDRACPICLTPLGEGKGTHVDHDHACCSGYRSCGKCVRAILCSNCNTGLGLFRDDRGALARALTYLGPGRDTLT